MSTKRFLVDRIFEFLFGADDREAVEDAIAQDEKVVSNGALPIRKADYIVEVFFVPSEDVFNARLITKTSDIEVESDGATPGDALAFVGALIDASLVRRGFKKQKAVRLNLTGLTREVKKKDEE